MLTTTLVIACGGCVHSLVWFHFPAIDSCVWIFPTWLLALAAIRSYDDAKLMLVPPLPLALILVILILVFAPAMTGPLLSFWIPISCVAGTVSGVKKPTNARNTVMFLAGVAFFALIGFGVRDYSAYNAMTPQERIESLPPHYRPNVDAVQLEHKR